MTISLPKPLKTYQYRDLTIFSLLDVDPDRVLPHLFELCVKGGRASPASTRPRNLADYRDRLLSNSFVTGFDRLNDEALLDGWLRSCVVEMGAVGRSRTGEQILGVAPLTLAAYRAGVLIRRDRQRGVDGFIYSLLLDELRRRGSRAERRDLRELVGAAVGRGLAIGPEPRWEPRLEDPGQLDISALLEYRLLEGLETVDARPSAEPSVDSPLPGVSTALGATLLAHIEVYGNRLPTPALMSSFAALMALGAFTFTLRVDAAARELLRACERPRDMRDEQPACELELYCDFTGEMGGESDGLSRRCVQRELERVRLAFRDRMTFVIVENALARMTADRERLAALPRAERLEGMAKLRGSRGVENYAGSRVDDIVADPGGDATELEREFLERIQGSDTSEVDKLLAIVEEVNQNQATSNAVKWFRSVGGLEKPYGLLQGTLSHRSSWRYAPSDELLTALLLAVFVVPGGGRSRPSMPLRDVLTALRDRFGILVDAPPTMFDGAEARSAAATNLEAFKRRLQLLGCFDSLSDDFSVQRVRHPLGDS